MKINNIKSTSLTALVNCLPVGINKIAIPIGFPAQKKMLFGLVSTSLMMAAAQSNAAIVLLNPSFETPDIANGTALFQGAGPVGWPGFNTYLVDNSPAQNVWFSTAVPNGQQAMSFAGNYITQQLNDNVTGAVLSSTFAQTFDITFFAARRNGASGAGDGNFSVILQSFNGAGNYIGDLAVQRYNLLGNDGNSSTIDLNLGVGQWSDQINLSLLAPANLLPGNNIRLVFAQNGATYGTGGGNREGAIDNVSITLVPEPSAAVLAGLSIIALISRRRK